jgi:hypothetical protein
MCYATRRSGNSEPSHPVRVIAPMLSTVLYPASSATLY